MNCQCCGLAPSVGIGPIPGVPMMIAWCQNCMNANVMPYWALVTTVALVSGFQYDPDRLTVSVKELVNDTLSYFNISEEQFSKDVLDEVINLSNEFLPTEEV